MLQRYKNGPQSPAGRDAHRSERMAAVAKALGMTVDEVRSALRSGKSLAKLPRGKGVSRPGTPPTTLGPLQPNWA